MLPFLLSANPLHLVAPVPDTASATLRPGVELYSGQQGGFGRERPPIPSGSSRILETLNSEESSPRTPLIHGTSGRDDIAVDFGAPHGCGFAATTPPGMTNHGAIVTGRVLGDNGKASPDASVVLLPADVSRWRPFPGLPAIPPKADGTFTIGPLRAGEYIVAAVTGLSMTKLFEPSARAEIAERIANAGERIILVENEKHSIDLRITKLQ